MSFRSGRSTTTSRSALCGRRGPGRLPVISGDLYSPAAVRSAGAQRWFSIEECRLLLSFDDDEASALDKAGQIERKTVELQPLRTTLSRFARGIATAMCVPAARSLTIPRAI